MALIFMLLFALSLSDGFNVDVLNTEQFSGNKEEFFGYKLLQYQSDEMKQIIVSAPLSANRSGAIFSCSVEKRTCSHLFHPDSKAIRFFGMSMAVRTSPSATLTSCSPSYNHVCDENSYLNGICYQFNSRLNMISHLTAAFQECTNSTVNLVFLFDGSSSMTTEDFNKNKKFIWDIVTVLKNSSIEFAAAQFSSEVRTVFTFKDYVNGMAKKKLFVEQHMKALTNTHKAINFVLEKLFNNVESGADPEATKALVIITDGSPSDLSRNEIQRCDELNIARFVIGVGTQVKIEKLKGIASEPKEQNTFMIGNYNGLDGLLEKLQNKIYGIEGAQGRNFINELSQSGFSAASDKDTLILGAVGTKDWRGTLYEVTGSGDNQTEIEDSKLQNDSYNGYSVAVGRRDNVSLVFSGAPRSNHRGEVTFFRKKTREWETMSRISGEQIGSYFGGSVCVLDLDSDYNTDFLVVGAPHYYQPHPQREGWVYIYRLTQELMLEKVLEVCESARGRFGMTLAAVADINGDQLQDLAVGAPLEDDQRGAVYIYLGKHEQGIRSQYSQRIVASSISKEIQYFGLAIDGVMDMGQDGLTDIAVGAQGTVLLFRTRPVVSVSANFSFSPSEINLNHFECTDQDSVIPIITLKTCFSMKENTNSKGAVKSGLNVSVELRADAVRQESRAFFIMEDKDSRSLVKSVLLNSEFSCFNNTVYMQRCVKDTLSPVLFRLNFHQSEHQPGDSSSILNIDSSNTTHVEVPFQINCKNRSCVSDLQLDFSFLNSTLLVVDQASFIIHVTLQNKGDDSFNTSVVLFYPPGLSLSVFKTIKANRRTLSRCGDRDEGALNKTTCSISLPVYRSNTRAEFEGVFRISRFYKWNESMQMTLVASSDNNGNISTTTVMKTLPVQFSVDVAISPVPELSVTYLNFSLEDKGPKTLSVVYKVSNLGLKDLPVVVGFWMPCKTPVNFYRLYNHSITVSQEVTACNKTPVHDDCTVEQVVKFTCQSFNLDVGKIVHFTVKALIMFPNVQQYTEKLSFSEFKNEEGFLVSAQMDFDQKLYHQLSSDKESNTSRYHHAEIKVKAELIIPPDMNLFIGAGVGGGLLVLIIVIILLWKCGFFKRNRYEQREEGGENWTKEEEMCGDETEGKLGESPSPEDKPFIPDGEKDVVYANGGRENEEFEKVENTE
ncbi:integrin alpha-D isoform X2 [Silurus meridionalis]|uniref:integrin alpha-D isoform X2 n=1 Tax=Silurus meridionalis TaxID=175797 RepID=UPI001EEB46CE|nr:integrin alpha-D isoform X2 [Silurus meridionalis]